MIAASGTTIRLNDLGAYGKPVSAGPRGTKPGKRGKLSAGSSELPEAESNGHPDLAVGELEMNMESDNVVCINDGTDSSSFMEMLRDYRLMLAESAIREHNGNKTLAARSLRISRAYLHRLLRNAGADDLDEDCNEAAL
jgi:DNA-binding NtrC family response regulator